MIFFYALGWIGSIVLFFGGLVVLVGGVGVALDDEDPIFLLGVPIGMILMAAAISAFAALV